MKKIKVFVMYVFLALLAFSIGILCHRRTVDPVRMEKCLEFYSAYRKNQDQRQLAANLNSVNLTSEDLKTTISKDIKSSMKQAMDLLKAFRFGFNFKVLKVEPITGMKDEPFRLDAEILAVFEKNAKLVDEAFES